MKKSTTILPILQSMLTSEEVQSVVRLAKYEDKARKFTVYHLLHDWCMAAFEQWDGYRPGADHAASSGLPQVHYSSFSGKAAAVPFPVFKALFHLLVRKCSRATRRKLTFPKELLLIDSTTMTVGKTRLPWAPYHGERAGIKLNIALQAENLQPLKAIETVGSRHDGPISKNLAHRDYIMVMDRAYGKLERLDRYKEEGQSFVIRLRDNVHLEKPRALRRQKEPESSVLRDKMCKARWQIEVFFRWIKQHLNLPTLFGTIQNAGYGQLFSALIVYVLLKWLFDATHARGPQMACLSFVRFSRLLTLDRLPVEWTIRIQQYVRLYNPLGVFGVT